jgi:hypothetical protein
MGRTFYTAPEEPAEQPCDGSYRPFGVLLDDCTGLAECRVRSDYMGSYEYRTYDGFQGRGLDEEGLRRAFDVLFCTMPLESGPKARELASLAGSGRPAKPHARESARQRYKREAGERALEMARTRVVVPAVREVSRKRLRELWGVRWRSAFSSPFLGWNRNGGTDEAVDRAWETALPAVERNGKMTLPAPDRNEEREINSVRERNAKAEERKTEGYGRRYSGRTDVPWDGR